AGVAVDGSTDGNFFSGSVTSTNLDTFPWWQVDLGSSVNIDSIAIWNRTDCCSGRLNNAYVFVSDSPFLPDDTPSTLSTRLGTIFRQFGISGLSTNVDIGTQGRYVRIQLAGINYLSLAEVQVFGSVPLDTSTPGQLTMSHTGDFSRGQPAAV